MAMSSRRPWYRRGFANAEAKRAKIQELVKQGKSLDEVRAAVDPPPATPPAGGGGRGGGFASYTQVVYTELTKP